MNELILMEEIKEYLADDNYDAMEDAISSLHKEILTEKVSKSIAKFIMEHCTHAQAYKYANLMAICIKAFPETALVGFPANSFFRVSLAKGSLPLYECYIQHVLNPDVLANYNSNIEKAVEGLTLVANKITEDFFHNYEVSIADEEFFGAKYTNKKTDLILSFEEGSKMYALSEHFNSIIGRRDILNDLESLNTQN